MIFNKIDVKELLLKKKTNKLKKEKLTNVTLDVPVPIGTLYACPFPARKQPCESKGTPSPSVCQREGGKASLSTP